MPGNSEKKVKSRNENFSWNTRQALFDYFHQQYHIDTATVNSEIYRALDAFKLRKDRPIDPRELWQKAGNAMRRRLRRKHAKSWRAGGPAC